MSRVAHLSGFVFYHVNLLVPTSYSLLSDFLQQHLPNQLTPFDISSLIAQLQWAESIPRIDSASKIRLVLA